MPLISSLGVMNPINFGLAGAFVPQYVASASANTPNNTNLYKWSNLGFGTSIFSGSASPPTTATDAMLWNKTGTRLLSVANNSLYSWPISYSGGFGTRTLQALPVSTYQACLSPDNGAIFFGSTVTPFLNAYAWNGASFGTKYTNPSTLPTASIQGICTPDGGSTILATYNASPYIIAYPWSNASGFGTKYANPSTIPDGGGDLSINSISSAFVKSSNASPWVEAFSWSVVSGFGSKYSAAPVYLSTNARMSTKLSPVDNGVAVALNSNPYCVRYSWDNTTGFGTTSTPSTTIAGSGRGVSFTRNGSVVGFAHLTTPFLSAYQFNSSGFGSKFSNPTVLPSNAQNVIAFY